MRLRQEIVVCRLKSPFATARGVSNGVAQRVIHVEAGAFEGVGAAVLADSEHRDLDLEGWRDITEILTMSEGGITTSVAVARVGKSAALALDLALQDLRGKRANLSVRALLNLPAPSVPSGLTIGRASIDLTLAQVQRYAAWPILKFKIADATDVEMLKVVRAHYEGRLWVDGNGAFTPEAAMIVSRSLADLGVELFEQPTPAHDWAALRAVGSISPVPIVADESAHSASDLDALVGAVHAVNVKLAKSGSLSSALGMAKRAKYLGLAVMIGCKTESVLSVTAIAQLSGLADYLDLDGNIDLVNDPFTGLGLSEGWPILPDRPGLGVDETGSRLNRAST